MTDSAAIEAAPIGLPEDEATKKVRMRDSVEGVPPTTGSGQNMDIDVVGIEEEGKPKIVDGSSMAVPRAKTDPAVSSTTPAPISVKLANGGRVWRGNIKARNRQKLLYRMPVSWHSLMAGRGRKERNQNWHLNRRSGMRGIMRKAISRLWRVSTALRLLSAAFEEHMDKIGYRTLCSRLQTLWKPSGAYTVIDLDHDFYVVRFENKANYLKVLTNGLWQIMNFALSVQPWYHPRVLNALTSLVVDPLRIDVHTQEKQRGKFARMAAENDLLKPLRGKVEMGSEVSPPVVNLLPQATIPAGTSSADVAQRPLHNVRGFRKCMNAPVAGRRRRRKETDPFIKGADSRANMSGSRYANLQDMQEDDGQSRVQSEDSNLLSQAPK
ncbi:hypothetical protein Tsubulata_013771 [Turnera subulata]|uniref:DUF4283 domain-containing protein n=1 Tax=Turnera subulata TaxID=218843 RepID=A0A9Q0FCP8_9ROSI|nr:hypothetical protein Tsubulata_013771 [Turnera subulata]